MQINFIESRRGNQESTIHRNLLHWEHKTQEEDKQNNTKQNAEHQKYEQHRPPTKTGAEHRRCWESWSHKSAFYKTTSILRVKSTKMEVLEMFYFIKQNPICFCYFLHLFQYNSVHLVCSKVRASIRNFIFWLHRKYKFVIYAYSIE